MPSTERSLPSPLTHPGPGSGQSGGFKQKVLSVVQYVYEGHGAQVPSVDKTEKEKSEGEGKHSKKNLGQPGLGKGGNTPQTAEKNRASR